MSLSSAIFFHFLDFENVYEPAEDSFILLDALEIELNWIEELKPTFAIEIGPGSGIISSAIAGLSVNSESYRKLCFVFSCDINISACKATQRTAKQNNVSSNIAVICDNLLGGLSYRMKEKVDLGKYSLLLVQKHKTINFVFTAKPT